MQELPRKTNHQSPVSWMASKPLIPLFRRSFTDILLCSLQSLLKRVADLALPRAQQQMALQSTVVTTSGKKQLPKLHTPAIKILNKYLLLCLPLITKKLRPKRHEHIYSTFKNTFAVKCFIEVKYQLYKV